LKLPEVVKRTFTDLKNPAGVSFNVTLPATFTDLKAAKEAARTTLLQEGYEQDFFPVYEVNSGNEDWTHGDGMIVYAEGPSHEIFSVEIEVVPTSGSFKTDETGRVRDPLYHVLQTMVHYDQDRSGSKRNSVIEGTYMLQEQAQMRALRVLLDSSVKKEDFVEYDEYLDGKGAFGDYVVVHAVKDNGENILVSVEPGSRV